MNSVSSSEKPISQMFVKCLILCIFGFVFDSAESLGRKDCEIKQGFSSLQNNKNPGPDGYGNTFYKAFKDLLTPLLSKADHYALDSKTMAPSWTEATIVVIHKEGKDTTECQSYKPISLLKEDLRILTAILTRWFNQIITQIIHPDQTGFVELTNVSLDAQKGI
uniref:Reverse transcriptase domain-containing protein n=1 Tax=Amphilophus citrinellus TaxID=61819 RepID=A0A3Q0R6D1_AMPCI